MPGATASTASTPHLSSTAASSSSSSSSAPKVYPPNKQPDDDSCGYYALWNAVRKHDAQYPKSIGSFISSTNRARVHRLEFNNVLESNQLADQYHVVMPYQPVSDPAQQRDKHAAALRGSDTVFIGQFAAKITKRVPDGTAPRHDFHYATLERERFAPGDDINFTSFQITCSAAGTKAPGMLAGGFNYSIVGATERIDLVLQELLVVRKGPYPPGSALPSASPGASASAFDPSSIPPPVSVGATTSATPVLGNGPLANPSAPSGASAHAPGSLSIAALANIPASASAAAPKPKGFLTWLKGFVCICQAEEDT